MSTNPQPPYPSAAPKPAGGRSHFLAIALLLAALMVVVGASGTWVAMHVLTNVVHVNLNRTSEGTKNVSIRTPLGSLEVHEGVNERNLDLPIYPGATHLKENNSATVNIDIADQAKVRVLAGKFETPDSLDKVSAFYHSRLDDQLTRFKKKDEQGKTVFEIKRDKQDQDRVVALKSVGAKTIIELVRVSDGPLEAN